MSKIQVTRVPVSEKKEAGAEKIERLMAKKSPTLVL